MIQNQTYSTKNCSTLSLAITTSPVYMNLRSRLISSMVIPFMSNTGSGSDISKRIFLRTGLHELNTAL